MYRFFNNEKSDFRTRGQASTPPVRYTYDWDSTTFVQHRLYICIEHLQRQQMFGGGETEKQKKSKSFGSLQQENDTYI